MRLAYYEEKDYHTEIMGLFLDYCIQGNHRCDYFNDKDQSGFLDHYESILNIKPKLSRYKNVELRGKIVDYDYVIIGTMGCSSLIDDLITKEPGKFLQVYHNDDDLKKDHSGHPRLTKNEKVIVLTPLNRKVGPYLLPIFRPPLAMTVPKKNEKIIAIVGRFTQHRTYESLLPLLKLDYTIWVISRRPKFVPEALVELANRTPKIKISYKLNAQKMSEILIRSRYLLCIAEDDSWYYKDRLTGTIPLSYNYDLPLIIPGKLNNIYKIKVGIEYDEPESIPERLREIDSTPGKYENIIQTLQEQKQEIVTENRKILERSLNDSRTLSKA